MNFFDLGYEANLDVSGPELDMMNSYIRKLHDDVGLLTKWRTKANVLYKVVDDFTRSKKVMQIAESILGENFHCWDAMIWIKQNDKVVSPHQDATYWNYLPKEKAFTMWVPLQNVGQFNGSICYAEKSHVLGQVKHEDISTQTNLLIRGQTALGEFNFTPPIEMKYGGACIHHPFTIHTSHQNLSPNPRFALNFMFVSYECKPILKEPKEYTMHLSGAPTNDWLYSQKPVDWMNLEDWKLAHEAQRTNYLTLK